MGTVGDPWFVTALGSTCVAVVALIACRKAWQRSRSATHALQHVSRPLRSARDRDPATGVLRPSKFDSEREDAALRSDASGRPARALYVDTGHFRSATDAFGRAAGNEALKCLPAQQRAIDRAFVTDLGLCAAGDASGPAALLRPSLYNETAPDRPG